MVVRCVFGLVLFPFLSSFPMPVCSRTHKTTCERQVRGQAARILIDFGFGEPCPTKETV